MRVVQIDRPGGPEVLRLVDAPDPEPGPGEVRIRVAAAGVNNADLLQRRGLYPAPPGAPPWPGLEVSGQVEVLGPGVEGLRPGQEVTALLDGGGYASHVVVRAGQCLPVPRAPEGTDPHGWLVDVAGLPEAACTVWSTLEAARLQPGETLLVHGGSGGVGSLAVQLGAALGYRVLTTAGGPERTRRCLGLGADVAIDHRSADLVEEVRSATDGRGVDVVLDVVGAAYLGPNLEVLATGGRLAVIGMQKGRRGELDLATLLTRRATVLGTTLRSRPPGEKARIVGAVRDHVWPLVDQGAVRPVVHERIPLEEAARAHDLLASGSVFGKLVLVP